MKAKSMRKILAAALLALVACAPSISEEEMAFKRGYDRGAEGVLAIAEQLSATPNPQVDSDSREVAWCRGNVEAQRIIFVAINPEVGVTAEQTERAVQTCVKREGWTADPKMADTGKGSAGE